MAFRSRVIKRRTISGFAYVVSASWPRSILLLSARPTETKLSSRHRFPHPSHRIAACRVTKMRSESPTPQLARQTSHDRPRVRQSLQNGTSTSPHRNHGSSTVRAGETFKVQTIVIAADCMVKNPTMPLLKPPSAQASRHPFFGGRGRWNCAAHSARYVPPSRSSSPISGRAHHRQTKVLVPRIHQRRGSRPGTRSSPVACGELNLPSNSSRSSSFPLTIAAAAAAAQKQNLGILHRFHEDSDTRSK